MVKLQELNNGFYIRISRSYIEQAKWKKGDVVTVSFNERGNLELRK